MKRILIFILALCLLVPCFGCNKAEAPEAAPSAEPTEKMNEEPLIEPSEKVSHEPVVIVIPNEKPSGYPLPFSGEVTPSDISEIDKDKEVQTGSSKWDREALDAMEANGGHSVYLAEHTIPEDERSDLIVPVYEKEKLLSHFGRVADCGSEYAAQNVYTTLNNVVGMCPTEAIRKVGDRYYIMYDTTNNFRLIVFFKLYGGGYCPVGYPIWMSGTYSYADFQEITIGDSIDKVIEIDPVAEFYTEWIPSLNESALLHARENKSMISHHLLTDGILKISYDYIDGEIAVTDMYYSPDFLMSSISDVNWDTLEYVYSDMCYQINPLDYIE